MEAYKTIDEYVASAPEHVQKLLRTIRKTIEEVVPPEAGQKISYGIPTYTLRGSLVHFGGYEGHVALYPGSAPIAAFKDELKPYETAKGTIRFPLDKPLPLDLIGKIVQYSVERNLQKKKS